MISFIGKGEWQRCGFIDRSGHLLHVPVGIKVAQNDHPHVSSEVFHFLHVPKREGVIITVGENNGIYISGDMVKVDENFLDMISKIQTYYEKFKSKWAKVISTRKKTPTKTETEA